MNAVGFGATIASIELKEFMPPPPAECKRRSIHVRVETTA